MSKKILKPLFFVIILCLVGYLLLINAKNSSLQEYAQVETTSIEYKNSDYGFIFTLPISWEGYTVVNDTWKAYVPNKTENGTPDETGPFLSVRNPLWSAAAPRQDIPILIFTIAQWNLLTQDKIHIGAAPINPSELGRNANYVFALPARYNYAFPLGYEEVESILQTKPLRGF